jgi:hypothetical protein
MVIAPLLHGDAHVSPQTSVRDRARTALRSLWAEVRGAARLAGRQPLFTSLLVVVLIGATLATGVAVGLWPAIRMSRIDPADHLRGLGRAAGASQSLTIRRGLVAAEVAISLVLAVSTALFVQSLRRVQEVAPGFASERVLSMRPSLSRERYKDRSEVLAFQERLQTRLRALPGVEAARV